MQVGKSVKMKDVAIACNLLHAPPLVRLGQEEVNQHSAPSCNTSFQSDDTTSDEEDNEADEDFKMNDSFESDESVDSEHE